MKIYPLEFAGNWIIVKLSDGMDTFAIPDAAIAFRRKNYVGMVVGNHYYVFGRTQYSRSPKTYLILKVGESTVYNSMPAFHLPKNKPYKIQPRYVRVMDRHGAVMPGMKYPLPGLEQPKPVLQPAVELPPLPPFPESDELAFFFRLGGKKNELICIHASDKHIMHGKRDVLRFRRARKELYGITYVGVMCRAVFYFFRNPYIKIDSVRRIMEHGTEYFANGEHRFVYRGYPKANALPRFIRNFA